MDQPDSKVISVSSTSSQPENRKLGVILLAGVVIGSMIGGGSFNLQQNMTQGAGLVAITIACVITFIGMYFLSNFFRSNTAVGCRLFERDDDRRQTNIAILVDAGKRKNSDIKIKKGVTHVGLIRFVKIISCSSIRAVCIVTIMAIFMVALIGDSPAYAAGSVVVDTGGTSWVLGSSALVLFMTLPGLALFYGGLVRTRNFLSVVVQCFGICCVVSVIWGLFGYSLAFGDGGPLIGSLDKVFLMNLGGMELPGNLPEIVFVLFQMMFAIITPALIIGAYVERVKLSFVIVFSALWLVLVYLPVTHWVWGGGWLNKLGIMDFAGGIVVHTTAGVSALVAAALIGVRRGFPDHLAAPYSLGMTMAGTGMLWVGWFGFNGGSALAANFTAGSAILATHFAAVTAGLTWVGVERLQNGKATILGLASGCVAGLATITPAAGFVGPIGGMVIGIASGVCCFFATRFVTKFLKVDDSLGVFGVHGVGGMLGSILVAFFAASNLGGAGFESGMDMGRQFAVQVLGVCATAAWSAFATYVLVKLLSHITGIRISAEEEFIGLDVSSGGAAL